MANTWSVTGMAKNHHCVSIVYRDTTQADYLSGETFNHSSSRHASTSSNHIDTGDSSFFFDDLTKPLVESSNPKESALPPFVPLDDIFDISHFASLPTDLHSPTRVYIGVAQDKALAPLDKPTAETGLPGQAFSPSTMEMWEQNETFQDLSELIQEGNSATGLPPVSSQSCYTLPSQPSHSISSTSSGTVSATSSRSCNSSPSPANQTSWQLQSLPHVSPLPSAAATTTTTAVSVKRPLSPVSEPGPSHASGPCSKLQKLEEPPPRYTDMRVKNNLASRRSRMTRKEKELEMEKRASELEQQNEVLRIQVKNLEELTEKLKKHLINSIVKK
ncbi:hypothetical protein HPB50_012257 [Hyalomma asiaticum]|uniref:Uncharacterized protein n=1 Tax=Hyalomma asiaticum TaxID=266040 RepID=A0ACB7S6W4_HYAAI|nr:hypothetical protein HPB50_012257 [Hyalomma asiaticum]